jgi:ligand-binding sensor domain-containing protein
MRARYIIAFFLSACAAHLAAQTPLLRNFNAEDGLPSSEAYCVLQDSRGYLWFSTDGGVGRFDGYSFKNYTTNEGLSDNSIFSMHEDRKGRIWFGSFNSNLSYFHNDTIRTIKFSGPAPNTFAVMSIYVDKGDTIWMTSVGRRHYYQLVPKGNDVYEMWAHPIAGHLLKVVDDEGFINGSASLREKEITRSLAFYRRDNSYVIDSIPSLRYDMQVRAAKSKGGGYYISAGNLLLEYSANGKMLWSRDMDKEILALLEDSEENLWVALRKGGVLSYPGGDIEAVPHHYLPDRSVSWVLEDDERGIWFTTLSNGVYYMESKRFLSYRFDSEEDARVNCVEVLNDSTIVAGTYDGNLYMIDSRTFELKKKVGNLQGGAISSITVCKDKTMIAYGGNRLVAHLDGNFRLLSVNRNVYAKMGVEDEKGNIWCGSVTIVKLNDPFDRRKYELSKISIRVNSMILGKGDTVWLGTLQGLKYYIPSVNKIFDAPVKDPLLVKRIDDIKMDMKGRMWLATRGAGLLLLDKGKVSQFTAKDGLISNIVRSLFIDDRGDIWIATNNGLNRLTYRNDIPVIERFSTAKGMTSGEINHVIVHNSQVWLATNKGLITFNTSIPENGGAGPPVYITSTKINENEVAGSSSFDLGHDENFISFDFVGLSYKSMGKVTYRYRMLGIDTSFSYTTRTGVQYTTLPPGDYTFEVYAMNEDGIWSAKPASVNIFIDKPFWSKWWFVSSMMLLGLGIVVFTFYYRLRQFKKREEEKMRLNRLIADTELRALRAQMNPHFVFNCLNSIQAFILKNDPDTAHKYLSKFSRLMRNVLDNSKYKVISLEAELATLRLYVELESLRFSNKFSYHFEIDPRLDMQTEIPSMLIQPYVENAIWHGLMHKDRPGNLWVRLKAGDRLIACEIEDDGVGRKKAMEYKEARKEPVHNSTGMVVTRERLEILNYLNKSNARIVITDLEQNGAATGTRVQIQIPVNPDSYDTDGNY